MEAHKIESEDRLRFRVHRDHGVVTFYGSLGDTPDTSALDGVLIDATICDLKNLAFASWIGLATLGTYINERKMKVTFRNIPFQIYDAMRLMKSFEEQNFESAELPLVNTESKKVIFELVDLRQLRKGAESGEEWFYTRPNYLVLIPVRYIFPDLVVQRQMGHIPVHILSPNKDIASFWLQYGSFCQSTIEISNTLIHAAKFNMIQILYEIKAKVAAGETALKLIDSKMNYTLVQRLDGMIIDMEKEYDKLSDRVQSKFDECETKLAHLSLVSLDKACEQPVFIQSFQDYILSVEGLKHIASTCEDTGASIGSKLSTLRSTQVIKNALASYNNPSPEALTAIRNAFAIMDIMSEDDWFATRALIMHEIETIEMLIGRCIVTLQVFDMMRQIMEHRIHEVEIVLFASESLGPNHLLDAELRDSVLTKIGAHMVTEQEKAAFAFYLPDGFAKFGQTERKEPGDVLLF